MTMTIAARGLGVMLMLGITGAAGPAKADPPYDWYNAWRGAYVGGLASYALMPQKITTNGPAASSASIDLDGAGGTFLLGYRWPLLGQRLTFGIEADGTFGQNNASSNGYKYTTDYLVGGRALLGTHFRPDLFWFVTGGVSALGVGTESVATKISLTGGSTPLDPHANRTLLGGTVGTGFEWETSLGFNVRADYLYTSFANWRVTSTTQASNTAPLVFNDRQIDTQMHQFRVGVVIPLFNPYDEDRTSGPDHGSYK